MTKFDPTDTDKLDIAVAALEAIVADRHPNPFMTQRNCGSAEEIARNALSMIRGECNALLQLYLEQLHGPT